MRDALIAVATLAGLVLAVVLRRRAGAEDRRRAKAIADATHDRHGALTEKDAAFVAEHAAAATVWRTGEIPKYVDPTRPTVRRAWLRYRRPGQPPAKKVPTSRRAADPLTGALPRRLERPVMVPPGEPSYLDLDFTGGWERSALLARVVRRQEAQS